MRVRVVGGTESARVIRSYLEKAGVAVCDRLPRFAVSCTIHLSEHSGKRIIVDSVDSPLELHILRHITENTVEDIILRRRTGLVSTENEIHLSVPIDDPESAHAVEVGVLRGVQRAHFHRPWWRKLLPLILLCVLLPCNSNASPPRYSLFANTEGGTIHISMPPGGLFPQFQTGGGTSPCSGTTAPAHSFCGNNTGSVAAPAYVSLTAADLPGSITSSTSGNASTATSLASAPSTCGAGVAAIGVLANGNATGCFTPGGLANPMTTLGDIIYGASSGTPTRLGANPTSTNQFLRSVSSGVPVWAQVDYASVSGTPQLPVTKGAIASNWLNSYTSSTGLFTATQPTISDIAAGTSSAAYTLNGDLTVGKVDSIRVVDGTRFTTSASAQSDCGSVNPCVVIVPSTYAGASAAATFNITMLDFTGGTPAGGNEGIELNSTTASNLQARFRVAQNPLSPTGTSVGIYGLNVVQNAIPSAQSQIGMAGEVDTAGTVTTSAQGTLVGVEGTVAVNSTGGSLPDIRSFTANMFGASGNTTPVSQMVGYYSQAATNAGSGTITNVYGILAENQTIGTSNNLSIWAKGATQTDGKALFDCSAATVRCVVISGNALSNNNELEIVNTGASGNTWDIGEMMTASHLSFRDLNVGSGPAWSLAVTGSSAVEGIFSHANTANRTYTLPDASGTVAFNPPAAAGTTDLGTTALPFGNLWLGTAATNNFKLQPASTTGARIITLADPLSPTTVALPLTIGSGTAAMTTAAVAGGACGTTVTVVATGVLTTDIINVSRNAAATAANGGLLALNWWPTAGNVNFNYCNGGTVSNTPTAMTLNWKVVR